MKFGICLISLVPVRAIASDVSEMVTQLLFGELVVIQEVRNNWLYIRNTYDNYEGWVDSKQIQTIEEEEFNRLNAYEPEYVSDLVEVVQDLDKMEVMPVVFGSSIRNLNDHIFIAAGKKFEYTGQLSTPRPETNASEILENAMMYLNAPYMWGGKSPFGIDCSGFIQLVYMMSGIRLLRDASLQSGLGEHISFLDEAQPGDLLFFDNEEGDIVHVGIYMQNSEVIHASGKVKIDKIDHQGIYSEEVKKYTHTLRLIRRIL